MENILSNLFLVENNMRFWSGTARITEDYLQSLGIVDVEALLNGNNDETATIGGTIKIIDPKYMRPFNALRKRVDRYLQSVGIRFLGGYATPLALKDKVSQALSEFKLDYGKILGDFIQNYPLNLNNWAFQHPEWKNLIVQMAPAVNTIENRFRFDWNEYQIKPLSDGADANAPSPAEEKIINSLNDKLFDEIAADARNLWRRIQGRKALKSKSINPLRQMNAKLAGLCILNPCIEPVSQTIKEVLMSADQAILNNKEVSGSDLAAINGLLLLLSNPDNMKEAGQLAIENNSNTVQYTVAEPEVGDETGSEADNAAEPQSMEDWMQVNNYMEPEVLPETNNSEVREPEAEPQSMEDWLGIAINQA